ncbi:MAG TPA: RNase adapter RapZ [Candidatus Limnocylindria bacterium]|jgi:RNase adapter protein RapZ|nr:RNase adapter RapZ [Candidatus Limnocylindria bacterium]
MAEASGHATARPHVAIISGLSGAGKTTASKLLEDLGYSVIDNLPAELLRDLVGLIGRQPGRYERTALVLDSRSPDPAAAFRAATAAMAGKGIEPQVFFLEARDDVLIRRFSETRHRHPLEEGDDQGVGVSISRERDLLDPIRSEADVIIDTSDLSGRQLRERLQGSLSVPPVGDAISVHVITFGYKHGIPLEADIVFDVRFMENPFYIDRLRPLSGLDEQVREFVLGQPITARFLDYATDFLAFSLPAYEAEGKARLTVALGCTGGYHRSIAIGEELAERLRQASGRPVSVWHRELDRG